MAENMTENCLGKVAESDSEKLADKMTESDFEKVADKMTESDFETVADKMTESDFEKVADKMTESEFETVAENVTESEFETVAENVAESDFKKVAENVAESDFEKVSENIEAVWPDLQQFYDGQVIFITGATGFLGKVLLEKLLRSFDKIKKIYILIRPSVKDPSADRLSTLLDSKVFDRIRFQCPTVLSKLLTISGEITLPDLGMKETDLSNIINEVSIVFHVAATVRFDETARKALNVNLLGTKYLLEVAEKMKNLMAFIHVSTAYGFCNRPLISESLFSEKIKPEQLISMIGWIPDDLFSSMLNYMLSGRPYAYHFSKAMAEHYLAENKKDLPIVIIRPSIVTASWKDPFPGWIDTFNGPSGMIVACGKGIVRTVLAYPDVTADFIPVDVVANSMIAAARQIAIKRTSDILIINCTASPSNMLTWGQVEQICYPLILTYPSMELFRHPGGSFKKNDLHHHMSMFFSHFVPAYLTDIMTYPIKGAPRMVKIYKMVHRRMKHFEFFTVNHFNFERQNFEKLWSEMTDADKEKFPFNMELLSWSNYMDNYVLGIRRFLLGEKDESLREARLRMRKTYYLWLMIKVVTIMGLSYAGKKMIMPYQVHNFTTDFLTRYLASKTLIYRE